jgi:hypothetical protein
MWQSKIVSDYVNWKTVRATGNCDFASRLTQESIAEASVGSNGFSRSAGSGR